MEIRAVKKVSTESQLETQSQTRPQNWHIGQVPPLAKFKTPCTKRCSCKRGFHRTDGKIVCCACRRVRPATDLEPPKQKPPKTE